MIYESFDLSIFLIVMLVIVVSMTLHEYAHARVAVMNGDYTPKFEGRLTLNPMKHFDPIGFVMLMVAGFGFAKPVPVRPNNFKKLKLGIFTVSIAGIVVNLLLAFFSAPLFLLSINRMGDFTTAAQLASFFANLFYYMMAINVSLALFNLLPLYPLDGFRVVEAFTSYKNPVGKFLRQYGYYILIGLIGWSVIIDILNLKQVSPVFYYLDFIELYIRTLGGFVQGGFLKFWQLFIKF